MLPSTAIVQTSYGLMEIKVSSKGLQEIKLLDDLQQPSSETSADILEVVRQLEEFFRGERSTFDIPIDYSVMPVFQADVLKLVRSIPYGKTRTYGQIASHLGNPKAARAVGQANGNNPMPIVIPCHRVLGSGGSLTGYAYGLDLKKRLLALENPQAHRPQMKLFAV